ncbi:2-hydroxymethylglutarate dehydrogenase [Aequitasia blattaphilus]|uniref:NAD(P)-dependent oxidoreductase n=1 Tax=Aequitasia blattaphilus TaxID=2949332 RepID=A0ABT1E7Q4_9FIRM|nr:NAD(P)-dependent oxidoreductase [Aequitasia blattaphilus]MCP1101851.1 NAD(P)-dependent oxidoreductase [Aequitasia blattaphilus]MCR8614491.1 NAD(P)-dependent oxidoreductase [Aequitasia blattaphilus]
MKIGLIGLGAMGKPMALNLMGAGYEVYVYDVRDEVVKELEEKVTGGCKTVAELASKSDTIISSLPNAKIVEAVMTGEDGVFKNSRQGTIIIDMSSVSPGSSKRIAKKAEEYGIDYIDAPVSGGVSGASAGTLTIMVGGKDDTFFKVKPLFEVLGKNIYHVGEVGCGDAIKMINNLLLGCNMAALAEALALGVKCGLSVEIMREVISKSSGRSYALEAKLEKFIMANSYSGGFAVDLQHKDLGIALEASKEEAVPLPVTATAAQVYETARAKGLNRRDMSSIVKIWEDLIEIEISGKEH